MCTPNFYAALGVREDAPMREICQAYQQYAPLCHPDSQDYDETMLPIKGLTQQEYWLLINEACEVLTNAEWRARYNVGTLKQHFPVYEFSGNCLELYKNFVINPCSFALMPPDENNNQSHVLKIGSLLTVPSLTFFVELEVEELFNGTTKEITFPRIDTVDGRYRTIIQTLSIPITPDMRHGGVFDLKGFGHWVDDMRSDVLVVLHLKPHKMYTLDGDDLVCNIIVPLSIALFGGILQIQSIDGKTLTTAIYPPFPTAFPLVKRFEGEGLKTATGRGNLFVNIFHIWFATRNASYTRSNVSSEPYAHLYAQHPPHTVASVKFINGTARAISRVITLFLLLPSNTAPYNTLSTLSKT
ncbi:LOW QUALITY PROTEIN: curved DNA-binding protein-like [Anopheles marshallii]|uniref:LOW QUALITY PROTEIN: curved DNA-binding protein-like n=1 Tax=Anopheles marshallii TaxID=1521116 RepID=UPI00237BBDD2|nr:LOW QUALITY PROTEIN: curved DNA-binding protein-like [Anopheles marshallii]